MKRRNSKTLPAPRRNNGAANKVSGCIAPSSLWDIASSLENIPEHASGSLCKGIAVDIPPAPQPITTAMNTRSKPNPTIYGLNKVFLTVNHIENDSIILTLTCPYPDLAHLEPMLDAELCFSAGTKKSRYHRQPQQLSHPL